MSPCADGPAHPVRIAPPPTPEAPSIRQVSVLHDDWRHVRRVDDLFHSLVYRNDRERAIDSSVARASACRQLGRPDGPKRSGARSALFLGSAGKSSEPPIRRDACHVTAVTQDIFLPHPDRHVEAESIVEPKGGGDVCTPLNRPRRPTPGFQGAWRIPRRSLYRGTIGSSREPSASC